jgi:glycosyltransferase involved in cell wall biosynthesis
MTPEALSSRPKVSVFTPSHRPTYLDEAYASLARQSFEDWEWVVLLNGNARWTPPDDDRVRVQKAPPQLKGVGALKQLACTHCSGDIFFELDHDDVLASSALERVVEVFDQCPEVSLVYSHFAQMNEDGSRCDDRFNEAMGWRYEDVVVDGTELLQCTAFEPYPSNVGYIWYAPNHLRAFRASTYENVGGYSPQLDVLDDQDLMSLLYLEGDFALIDECLYLQRVHGRNTQANPKLNNRIQVETVHLYDHYIESLSLAWAERQGLIALDLGAAHNKPEGYTGVDLFDGPGVDIVADVAKGLDLPDGSVGVIRAVDFLEHVPDKVALFNELYRLLAHGGMLLTHTPSSDGRGAYQDPTHCAFYNENSFWYFTDADFARFVPTIECRFQVSRLVTYFPNEWHEQHLISYVMANLIAVKDGPRLAGELQI